MIDVDKPDIRRENISDASTGGCSGPEHLVDGLAFEQFGAIGWLADDVFVLTARVESRELRHLLLSKNGVLTLAKLLREHL